MRAGLELAWDRPPLHTSQTPTAAAPRPGGLVRQLLGKEPSNWPASLHQQGPSARCLPRTDHLLATGLFRAENWQRHSNTGLCAPCRGEGWPPVLVRPRDSSLAGARGPAEVRGILRAERPTSGGRAGRAPTEQHLHLPTGLAHPGGLCSQGAPPGTPQPLDNLWTSPAWPPSSATPPEPGQSCCPRLQGCGACPLPGPVLPHTLRGPGTARAQLAEQECRRVPGPRRPDNLPYGHDLHKDSTTEALATS